MSTQPEEHSMKHHKRPLAGYEARTDRKSTRLNSSHTVISYAVFCLKKKKKKYINVKPDTSLPDNVLDLDQADCVSLNPLAEQAGSPSALALLLDDASE